MVLDETLDELKKRCRYAVQHNFGFAKGEEYVETLGGGEPPNGVEKFSAAHVLHLLEGGAKAHKAAPVAKVEAAPAATPAKKAAPKKAVEAKAEAKVEAKLSEKKEDEDDRPTLPVDIRAVHAAAQATKGVESSDDEFDKK